MQSPSPSDRPSSINSADPGARTSDGARTDRAVGGLAAASVAVTAIAFAARGERALRLPGAARGGRGGDRRGRGCGRARRAARRRRGCSASEEWQRKLRGELMSQAAFLDEVVGSLAAMTSSRDAAHVLDADGRAGPPAAARPTPPSMLVPSADGRGLRPAVARGVALGPIAEHRRRPGERRLAGGRGGREPHPGGRARERRRRRPLPPPAPGGRAGGAARGDGRAASRCSCCSGSRATPASARPRSRRPCFWPTSAPAPPRTHSCSSASSRCSRRRACARPSGPSSPGASSRPSRTSAASSRCSCTTGRCRRMSGIAMMLDAVAEDTADGSTESALRVLETARERQRSVIRSLRELSLRARAVGAARPGLRRRPARARRRDGARPRRLGRARRRAGRRPARRRPGVPVPDRARGRPERRQARRAAVACR